VKQFIFISIALVFITSLLPANLFCQSIVGDDPPNFNLGVPYPVEHKFATTLGDYTIVNKEEKQESKNEKPEKTGNFQFIFPFSVLF
jgi:hypothetical protein